MPSMHDRPVPQRAQARRWFLATTVALGLSLLALFAGATLYVLQANRTIDQVDAQADLSVRLRDLQTMLVTLGDAETGQRGFLLTGKDRYLAPYEQALVRVPVLMASLDRIRLDDPGLRQHIDKVRALMELKFQELRQTVELHRARQHARALDMVQSDVGQSYSEQVRTEVHAVLDIVRGERDRLSAEVSRGEARSQRLLIVSVSLFAGFVLLAAAQIWLAMRTRRQSDQLLAISEQQHRALVEEQAELVSQSTAKGMLTYVNPAYARYFGFEPAELIGRSLYDFVNADDRAAVRAHIDDVFAIGEMRQSENRMTVPQLGERWVAWTNRRQVGTNGHYLLHSVGRDFTDRKATEDALKSSQAFLERTGRVAGVGGWEYDIRSDSLYWSDELRRMHEVEPDFVPTVENTMQFYVSDMRDQMMQAVRDGIKRAKPWNLELPVVTARGRRICVRTVGDVEVEQGKVVRLVGASQDVTERKALESKLRELTEIVEHTSDLVVQTDWRGDIQYMNPALRHVLKVAPEADIEGISFGTLNTPETVDKFRQEIRPAVKAHGVWAGETALLVAGRRVLPVSHLVIGHKDGDGRIERYSSVMRDISAESESRQRLLLETATLQSVTEAIPAVVAVVGADERYRFVNRALEEFMGRPREQILGRQGLEILGEVEYNKSKPWVDKVLAGDTVSYEKTFEGRSTPVHMAINLIPLRVSQTKVDGFVVVAQDITRHHVEAARLLRLAERDPLTGLLNRAGFDSYMHDAINGGDAARIALLYIDLDHFKPVNDTHGHPVGDQVLRQFAQRLKTLVRPTDAVARIGGDEFAVVLAGVREVAHAEVVADKVVEVAHTVFEVGGLPLSIGASVGLAIDASGDGGLERIIARADGMLYRAKAAGRGTRRG